METESANYALLRSHGIGKRRASQIVSALGQDECSRLHVVRPEASAVYLLVGTDYAYEFIVGTFRARQIGSKIPLDGLSLRIREDARVHGSGATQEVYGGFELVCGLQRVPLWGVHRLDKALRFASETGIDASPVHARLKEAAHAAEEQAREAKERDARFAELLVDEEVLRRAMVLDTWAHAAAAASMWDYSRDDLVRHVESVTGLRGITITNAVRFVALRGLIGAISDTRPLVDEDAALAYRVLEHFPELRVDQANARVMMARWVDVQSRTDNLTFFSRMAPVVDDLSAVSRAHGAESVSKDLTTGFSNLRALVYLDWRSSARL